MDKALLERVEKQAIFHRYPHALPAAILVVGILLTFLFVLNVERADSLARKVELDADATALVAELESEASENIAYLKAAASLFAMGDDISESEFAAFFGEMSADHRRRGTLGIGWAQWIRSDQVDELEMARRRLNPDRPFSVTPKPTGEPRYMAVITHLEPADEPNRRALGFDMYSESVRREAMYDAMQRRRPVASGKVRLVQDRGKPQTAGTLIFFPVFERLQPGSRAEARLKGFVYTPMRIQDFLATALAKSDRSVGRIEVYDGPIAPENLLAASGQQPDREGKVMPFEFAGRSWNLLVMSPQSRGLTPTGMLVLALGSIISILFAALGRMATSRAAEDRKVLEWLSRQSAIRDSLTRELNHRVKNTLANVLSIVALTKRRTSNVVDFAESLTGRIRALSATHDLLSRRDWKNALVGDVVTSELAPYLDPEDPHAEVSGPDALLAPNDAMSLGLALHELSTNAAKYGALSVPEGHVSVTWELRAPESCVVRWRERGGPVVRPPQRRGFGLELVEKIVSAELHAPVDLRFEPEGVACDMVVPLRSLSEFRLKQGDDY